MTKQGEFRFDPKDWPDPEAMVKELEEYGIKVMVSVWPTVDAGASGKKEMEDKGHLVRNDRGLQIHMNWMGETRFWDPFSSEAREFVWNLCRKNYYDKGIRMFCWTRQNRNMALLAIMTFQVSGRTRTGDKQLLSGIVCQDVLGWNDRQRPETGNESDTLCVGRKPEIRDAGLVGRCTLIIPGAEGAGTGRDKYGNCRNCVVGNRYRWIFRRLSGG